MSQHTLPINTSGSSPANGVPKVGVGAVVMRETGAGQRQLIMGARKGSHGTGKSPYELSHAI
jgi:hypothetical protein